MAATAVAVAANSLLECGGRKSDVIQRPSGRCQRDSRRASTAVVRSRGKPDACAAISSRLSFGVGSEIVVDWMATSAAAGLRSTPNVFVSTASSTFGSTANPRRSARRSVMMARPLWWQEKHARLSTKAAADRWSKGSARTTASRGESLASARPGSAMLVRSAKKAISSRTTDILGDPTMRGARSGESEAAPCNPPLRQEGEDGAFVDRRERRDVGQTDVLVDGVDRRADRPELDDFL